MCTYEGTSLRGYECERVQLSGGIKGTTLKLDTT